MFTLPLWILSHSFFNPLLASHLLIPPIFFLLPSYGLSSANLLKFL
uniref:Uncharacterized protein n=1 Tax=Rhizophora mucronata TaxID=61149 RepID=A0A2P2NAE3_RHIMU